MSPCEICEVEFGTLRCSHVGPLCFDCWGSGIHEAMRRKSSELREQLCTRLKRVRELILVKIPVCPVCLHSAEPAKRSDYRSYFRCPICQQEVAS